MSPVYYDDDESYPADRGRRRDTSDEHRSDRSSVVQRISWGAIIAGGIIALAVWIMLTLLGAGIGLSIAQPTAGATTGNIGISIGGGIWWVVSGLIALFAGGYVAARMDGVISAMDGVLQGVTTWAATTLVMLYLLTTAVGSLVGGAFSMAGSVASSAGQGIQSAAPAIQQASGISPSDLKSKVTGLLNSNPPPTPRQMTPEEAQAAALKLAPDLLSGGKETEQARQRMTQIVAAQSSISQQQASQKVDQWEKEAQSTAQQAKGTAKQAASSATNYAGIASLWGFVMLVLGAAAGAGGGAVGKRPRGAH